MKASHAKSALCYALAFVLLFADCPIYANAGSVSQYEETEEVSDTLKEYLEITDTETFETKQSDRTGDSEETIIMDIKGEGKNEDQAYSESNTDFTIRVLNGTYCSVAGYTGSDTSIVIPDQIDGYIVQSIEYQAFYGRTDLTSVQLPASLETLEGSAFAGCTNLEYIGFQVGLKKIGNNAFENCSSLQEVQLPSTLRIIEDRAFSSCTQLNAVGLPESLLTIGSYAFYGCTGITEMTLPDSIETLGCGVFQDCSELSSINYPRKLTRVEYTDSTYGARLFYGCTKLSKVTVPEGVTKIPDWTFSGNTDLREVVLPATLTAIGGNAFMGCSGVEEMNFNDGLKTIGYGAFSKCTALAAVSMPKTLISLESLSFSECTGLREITLNKGLKIIGASAFNGCTGLIQVNLPESLTAIESYAFAGCTSLTDLVLPDSVEKLGYCVFQGCTELSGINYPVNLATVEYYSTSYGARLFYGCAKLTKITVPEEVTGIPAWTFSGSTSLREVTLPDSLESVGSNAFMGCSGMPEIIFKEGLKTIESGAFSKCEALTAVSLPGTLTAIGNSAFSECTGLLEAVLIEGVEVIGNHAFEGCTSLEKLVLPDSLKTIGSYGFSGCTGLKRVSLPDGLEKLGCCVFQDCTELAAINYPAGLSAVDYYDYSRGARLFYRCEKLKEIKVPEGVTSIPQWIFSGSENLQEVMLPDTVTEIGEYAFGYCSGLEKVWVGQSVNSIGRDTFRDCLRLTIHGVSDSYAETYASDKNIPFSTESMTYETAVVSGKVIDGSNKGIQGISVSLYDKTSNKMLATCQTDENGEWICDRARVGHEYRIRYHHPLYKIYRDTLDCVIGQEGSVLSDVSAELLLSGAETAESDFTIRILNGTYCAVTGYAGSDTAIVIPDQIDGHIVQSIAYDAFRDKKDLTSIVLPSHLETIEGGAFYGCANLEYVGFNDGLKTIGGNAFESCSALSEIRLSNTVVSLGYSAFSNCTKLNALGLPDSLTAMESYAFNGCGGLTDVNLPDSVKKLGHSVFQDCSGLVSVNYPRSLDTVEYYGSSYGARLFYGCTKLKKIEVPEGVIKIPAWTFSGSTSLQDVILPSTLMSIESDAFRGCLGLEKIRFNEGLETIKSGAFASCTSLTAVSVPETLTILGDSAFSDCTGLREINVKEGMTTIGSSAFSGCISLVQVSLPETLRAIESYAFSSCSSLSEMALPDGVEKLGYCVFQNCAELSTINYPVGLTTVDDYSSSYGSRLFYGCTKLTKITVPEGVTAVPDWMFSGSNDLQEVNLPVTLVSIGNNAFMNCYGLKSVSFKENIETIGSGGFTGCTGLTDVSMPKSLTTLGSYAFSGCTGLREVALNNGLKVIRNNTFEGCTGLKQIVLPETLTEIESYGFLGCTSLKSVRLPDGVEKLGCCVFQNCTKLSYINYPASLTTVDDYSYSYGARLFYGCPELQEIRVPEGVTSIPLWTFSGSENLKEVLLPGTLTEIGEYAFSNCTGLEKVWVGQTVSAIESNAFQNCPSLTIHGVSDSYAETYAQERKIPFSTEPMTYDMASISGKVIDGLGKGIAGVSVSLYNKTTGKMLEIYDTDENGEWICETARVGHVYRIRYHHPRYKTDRDTFECVIGQDGNVLANVALELIMSGTETAGTDFTVRILNGTYCAVTGYTGNDTEIVIPDEIGSRIVQSIDSDAFRDKKDLKSIVLPGRLETIKGGAFYGCVNLEYVGFNDSLKTIGGNAFEGCSSLSEIRLSNTVTSLGNSAFAYCTQVTSLRLPDSLTAIEAYAFNGCTGLSDVLLPESVKKLGYCVFQDCSELVSVNYPRSLDTVEYYGSTYGARLFYGCTKLNRIEVPEGVTKIPAWTFSGSTDIEDVILPSTLVSIGSDAFRGCSGLEKMRFNEGLKTIESGAFASCTSLTVVSMPDTLNGLRYSAFSDCKGLREVALNEGLETIGGNAFYGCTSLVQVGLPVTLRAIESYAFSGCASLSKMTLPDGVEKLGYCVFQNCPELVSVNYPASLKAVEYSSSSYGSRLFYGCPKLRKITVPKGVTAIPDWTFSGSNDLQEVELPATLVNIGSNAFMGCSGLKGVSFTENLEAIGSGAFSGCAGLIAVTTPETLKSLGYAAFSDCTGLQEVVLKEGLITVESSVFNGCTGLAYVSLPKTLTAIESYAFSGCSSLTKMTLPNSVEKLGYCVFQNCTQLASVNYPVSLATVDSYSSSYGARLFYGCTKLKKIIVPDGVSSIPDGTFSGSAELKEVTLPDTLTDIGYSAFRYCAGLNELRLPEHVKSIGDFAYAQCTGLRMVTLNSSLTSIGGYAFDGCAGLTGMDIPGSVSIVGDGAFSNCVNLSGITLGKSLQTIGSGFLDGTRVESLIIPHSVTEMRYALRNAKNVREVVFEQGVDKISSYALAPYYSNETSPVRSVTVPDSVTEIGYQAFEGFKGVLHFEKEDSILPVYAIDHEIKYTAKSTGIADKPDRNLLREKTSYYTSLSTVTSSGYANLSLSYDFKETEKANISDMQLKIKIPSGTELIPDTFTMNNQPYEAEFDENGYIYIPVQNKSGRISFGLNISDIEYLMTYAQMIYRHSGIEKTETIGIVNIEENLLTINAPDEISKETFTVSGLTSPQQRVSLYLDGDKIGDVIASKTGIYSKQVTLENPQENGIYEIEARTVSQGLETKASAYTTFTQEATEITECTMYYRNNAYDLLELGGKRPIISWAANTSFTFSVKFTNADRIDEVNIVSTKSGETVKLPGVWDRRKQAFIAVGFDNYVPGAINVEYLKKEDNIFTNAALTYEKSHYDGEGISGFETKVEMDESTEFYYLYEHEEDPTFEVTDNFSKTVLDGRTAYISKEPVYIRKDHSCFACREMYVLQNDGRYTMYRTGVGLRGGQQAKALYAADPFEEVYKSTKKLYDLLTDLPEEDQEARLYLVLNRYIEKALDAVDPSSNEKLELELLQKELDAYKEIAKMSKAFNQINIYIKQSFTFSNDSELGEFYPDDLRDHLKDEMVNTVNAMKDCSKQVSNDILKHVMDELTKKHFWGGDSLIERIVKNLYKDYEKTKVNFHPKYSIDPSGYVYEAVESNRLENVKTTIYYKDSEKGEPCLWDAEEYDQKNPLYTDSAGFYAWDVPEGFWQVKYEMDGYETAYSEWLPVPPPQTEVNTGVVSKAKPVVESVNGYQKAIEVKFSKYMDIESLTEDTIKVTQGGTPLQGSIDYRNAETNGISGKQYASTIRFIPAADMEGDVQLTVSGKVKSYAGVDMGEDVVQNLTVRPEPQNISAEDLIVPYGENGTIAVKLEPADAVEGKKVKAVSNNPFIATVADEVVINDDGTTVIPVTGELPGKAGITLTLEGTDLQTTVDVEVTLAEVMRVQIRAKTGMGGTVSGGGVYEQGEGVTLTATPEDGYRFDGWYEGDQKVNDAGQDYQFIAEKSRTLEARFTPNTLPEITGVTVSPKRLWFIKEVPRNFL